MYDEEGKAVWERSLDSNGKPRQGDNTSCPFLYQGQYWDSEIELAYNRFRYYSTDTGGYISKDPIGLASGEFNFYAYVEDTNGWIDPLGLKNCYGRKKAKRWTDSCGRKQITYYFSSRKAAKEAAKKHGGLWSNKPEKHKSGGRHFHDIHHNNLSKPNIHYEFER